MPPENLTGRTVGGYRLLERVGEGGTATVYRAEHPEHQRCAVKILKERLRQDPTAIKRFLREAGYGSRVHHPAVVWTYGFGEEDGLYYMALEWADGQPLSTVVHRTGRLAPDLVAHIITQLAAGLATAHQAGIIHRDLKPDNIVFDANTRTVKLLDFGIARDAQQDPSDRLTRTGFFVGTLHYVAPEALSGELVGEAADTYSLATISYFLLTGRRPYSGESPRELFQQLLTEPPIPLSEAAKGVSFPRKLENAVMRGLGKDPAKRQAGVLEFARDVAEGVAAADEQPTSPKGLVGALKSLWGGNRPKE